MKTILYVDGFNFFYSFRYPASSHPKDRDKFPIHLGWCDFRKLVRCVIPETADDTIVLKYFTASVREVPVSPREPDDQILWLQAVRTMADETVHGFHRRDHRGDWTACKDREEKQTDVNIAIQMVYDALVHPEVDRLVLLSQDVDLAPAVALAADAKRNPHRKRVDVLFMGEHRNEHWKEAQTPDGWVRFHAVRDSHLRESRLPDRILWQGKLIESRPYWRE